MQSRGPCLWRGGGGKCKKGCHTHMRTCVRSFMVRFVLWNAFSRRRSIPVAQGKSAQAGMATRHARKGVWNVPCHNSPPVPQICHARQLTRGKNGPKWPDMFCNCILTSSWASQTSNCGGAYVATRRNQRLHSAFAGDENRVRPVRVGSMALWVQTFTCKIRRRYS